MKINVQELMNKIDEKNRYYILIGILVLFFLLDFFLIMQPQLTTLTKIKSEINILSQDIQTAQNDTQKMGYYQGEVKRLEKVLQEMSKDLKSRDDVSTILENISRLANESDVKIDQITPLNQDQEVLLEDGKRIYHALPILIEARCGYHNFGRFLNHLEQDNSFLSVTTFSLVGGEDLRYHALKMNIQAIVFEDKAP